ncbi:MAG: (d)CMP kinase [Deltaproteobacteria bacterium]|nr:(d)CMP kinase [Deltaproteobacteria bacterium]
MKRLIITIDGPSGAGKTTVSRMLADRLGYKYIDTGALYRGVALEAISAGLNPDDDTGLENILSSLKMKFVCEEKEMRLISNDLDITDKIRTPEISMFASAASARPVVRKFLLELQRELGRDKGVVFEGRDMGTVVFPDADVKFYLDASHKTRSLRRYREFKSETSQTLEEVEKDIKRRDKNEDAVIIDSTHLSAQDVVDRMMNVIEDKKIIVF